MKFLIVQCFYLTIKVKLLMKLTQKKIIRMASFYQLMRRKLNILIDQNGKPTGIN